MVAPANPCTHCEYRQDCGTNVGLERLIYDRPTFKRPVDPAAFIKSGVGRETYALLSRTPPARSTSRRAEGLFADELDA